MVSSTRFKDCDLTRLYPLTVCFTSAVEAKELKRVELSTFKQVAEFFVKTIESAFGAGEEFSSNEVTDHLLTTDESISAYDVSRGGMYLFKFDPLC